MIAALHEGLRVGRLQHVHGDLHRHGLVGRHVRGLGAAVEGLPRACNLTFSRSSRSVAQHVHFDLFLTATQG